ncbi:YqiA/YcfP family alpha/beta fold hydrolase [Aneurinibacillus migulanus]|uniref:Esterase n=1 Tax=Aneurinibacillus migulanus TaxID=47500 RepID=A0A1G8HB68_ANEMI|nr:YqiA/YcfP family alpha/beta fold hydrolase [Aneurinibacillus migulanus]MCP1354263.1 hypothetical protein [Aneurinibacillus migulanus]MED0891357.1 YqiA/YcfP family alpha/beta fold hydrolase [Aneurinibacillus migulanus]MED1613954.1 YqiA/YcfP family alpha/beta fold hydrolase [Aneurinibacillus migulanus]SDI03896.1 hypothetical protein SAMN04487909_101326 [Aneurinibacillus migulanus]GED12047.1 esterase YqiA [Aneurinibacillus migulanus]
MLLNIHGFSSSGTNAKYTFLRSVFPEETIVSFDLPIEPRAAIRELEQSIEKHKTEPILLVGSSLGGFYAYYLSVKYDCHAALLNPSLMPFATLMDCLGENTNYDTGEPFVFTEGHIKQLRDMFQEIYLEGNHALLHVFVCEDDERLDHTQTRKMLKGCGTFVSFPNGGHRFAELERIQDTMSHIYAALIK